MRRLIVGCLCGFSLIALAQTRLPVGPSGPFGNAANDVSNRIGQSPMGTGGFTIGGGPGIGGGPNLGFGGGTGLGVGGGANSFGLGGGSGGGNGNEIELPTVDAGVLPSSLRPIDHRQNAINHSAAPR